MIRTAFLLVWLISVATRLGAQEFRYATSAVRMRADASTESAVLATVARGSRVEVRACAVEWCWIEYRGKTGYVSERFLAGARHVYGTSGSLFRNSNGNLVPSPMRSTSGPPPGATAKCRDGSYSFSETRIGTCSHHGGVVKWL
jgi:uncharacterized protein YgiM (DUF1202 family)